MNEPLEYSIKTFLEGDDVSTITFPQKSASHKMKSSMEQRDKKISLAAPSNSAISLIGHRCDSCSISFRFDAQLGQHLKSKTHLNKVNDRKLKRANETQPPPTSIQTHDFSLVIPLNLDPNFVDQQSQSTAAMVDTNQLRSTKFNDEDLIDLADNNSFLDDNNVQLIIVNEANQDVMLMTSNEVKLSDAASEDNNLII